MNAPLRGLYAITDSQLLANGGQPFFKLRGKLGGGNAFGLLQHPGKTCSCVAQRSAGDLQRRGIQGK